VKLPGHATRGMSVCCAGVDARQIGWRPSAFRLVGNGGKRYAWMASVLHVARERLCTCLKRRAIRICPLGIAGLER
jgi:hypothetical protein